MNVKVLTADESVEEIKSQETVLLYVYSIYCGPCKMLLPVYDELANELEGISVVKLDSDDDQNAGKIQQFGVSALPTVMLFKNGKEVDRFSGFKPKDTILEWVNSNK